ncbi:MAG TPA: ATPase domain-containing protein [Streptosporangiaceae bacterium]|nr:ATPase domain-containing protein [Streptosporangiaceae bacterium]
MTNRLTTGTGRLDAVLGGGLPKDAISMVIGLPGSGKTILAQQCVFNNAQPERPALYLSTVSEPLEKIVRYGQTLSFFDPTVVGTGVRYHDLGSILGDKGLPGMLERVRELIRESRPAVIVIDSFKALHPYAPGAGDFRRFLYDLAGMLSAFPVTSLWVGEYEDTEIAEAPEFAVADAIIAMGTNHAADRATRALQVLKLRGGGFLSGKHSYRISADGIAAFPRLADPGKEGVYPLGKERISSGVQAIDDMVGDGYWPGASTLIAGPTGIGKTLMGLHFIFNGARQGEPGLIATLQENPTQLQRTAEGFGWSITGEAVELMYRSPVDLYLDEWVHDLLDTVESTGAKRVLVDSLGDLRAASPDLTRFREYTYSLLQRCSRRGVSIMLTYEVAELFGLTTLTENGASHLSDNVVLLQYRRADSHLTRTLTVLKTRAHQHDTQVREFEITPDGITLTQPAS